MEANDNLSPKKPCGGIVCAMFGCTNKNVYTEENRKTNRTFLSFPKDPTRCMRWKLLCRRSDANFVSKTVEELHKNYKICSDHFTLDQFNNPNVPRRTLKFNAEPNTALPGCTADNAETNTGPVFTVDSAEKQQDVVSETTVTFSTEPQLVYKKTKNNFSYIKVVTKTTSQNDLPKEKLPVNMFTKTTAKNDNPKEKLPVNIIIQEINPDDDSGLNSKKEKRNRRVCSVFGCTNWFDNTSMRRFPADAERCKLWQDLCCRGDQRFLDIPPRALHLQHKICATHFSDKQFNIAKDRGRLKANAYPDQNLPKLVNGMITVDGINPVEPKGSQVYREPPEVIVPQLLLVPVTQPPPVVHTRLPRIRAVQGLFKKPPANQLNKESQIRVVSAPYRHPVVKNTAPVHLPVPNPPPQQVAQHKLHLVTFPNQSPSSQSRKSKKTKVPHQSEGNVKAQAYYWMGKSIARKYQVLQMRAEIFKMQKELSGWPDWSKHKMPVPGRRARTGSQPIGSETKSTGGKRFMVGSSLSKVQSSYRRAKSKTKVEKPRKRARVKRKLGCHTSILSSHSSNKFMDLDMDVEFVDMEETYHPKIKQSYLHVRPKKIPVTASPIDDTDSVLNSDVTTDLPTLTCKSCQQKFEFFVEFKNHKCNLWGNRFWCLACDRSYITADKLNSHKCTQRPPKKKTVTREIKEDVRAKMHSASKASQNFEQIQKEKRPYFRKQLRISSAEDELYNAQLLANTQQLQIFPCKICNKTFSSFNYFLHHPCCGRVQVRPIVTMPIGPNKLKIYDREEFEKMKRPKVQLACQLCSRKFKSKRSLKMHQNYHRKWTLVTDDNQILIDPYEGENEKATEPDLNATASEEQQQHNISNTNTQHMEIGDGDTDNGTEVPKNKLNENLNSGDNIILGFVSWKGKPDFKLTILQLLNRSETCN